MKPYHFYVSFNPLFNEDSAWKTQAHEFHQKLAEKKQINNSAKMYWGKIQLSEHSRPVVVSDFKQVHSENLELQMETHIYITDYQHLWVGKVIEVTQEIPSEEETLPFYKNKKVEMWFGISDFDLLSNKADETLALLKKLHVENEYYDFKLPEITPFVPSIRFPLIVQDRSRERYFKPTVGNQALRVLEKNPHIAESGPGLKIDEFIKSFVITEKNFKLMPESLRFQITNAEVLLVEAQSGYQKDRIKLERAILTYLKCLEILLNETFVAHLRQVEGYRIWVTKDQESPKFIRSALDKDKSKLMKLYDSKGCFNLNQIKMLLDTPSFFAHTSLDYVFRQRQAFWEFCRLELRPTLKNESLIELRNDLASANHTKAHERELLLVRNILLGVGGRGIFNQIIESWFDGRGEVKKKSA